MRKRPQKPALFLRILLFLAGVIILGGSAYSVYCGHIKAEHVFYRATDPKTFWYCIIVYALAGVGAIYISTRSSK